MLVCEIGGIMKVDFHPVLEGWRFFYLWHNSHPIFIGMGAFLFMGRNFLV